MAMEVSVRNSQRAIKVNRAGIERVLKAALRHLSSEKKVKGRNLASGLCFEPSKAAVSVLLVSDKRMRELNRAYRGIDRATDVLSFSQLEGPSLQQEYADLGDIVISPSQAYRRAKERGASLQEELSLLLVHGLLHLIGYDHEKSRYQAAKMRDKERELLDAVKKVGR